MENIFLRLFSLALSTMCDALNAGRLVTWPDITSAQVRCHPPVSIAMIKGHLNQQWANLHSTKPKIQPMSPMAIEMPTLTTMASDSEFDKNNLNPMPEEPLDVHTNYVYTDFQTISGQVYSDQMGHFPAISMAGNKDILIVYCYNSNYIHAEPMHSHTGAEIIAAYK